MHPTDETIMDAVAAGQLPRLAELYRRYRTPLFGYLMNRTGHDRATAEDVLHATFERIIRYRTSYRRGQAFKAWIFTVARNALTDHQRRGGRLPVNHAVEPASLPLATDCSLNEWIRREEGEQRRAALTALPDNYREVIELAWTRQLKYAEIATLLGTTEANVKVRMHRACKQLRKNYQSIDR